ncbi:MAG: TetR/AcrR family transcriptional regulator [Alphaproteobacteria bacterium]|nr:TetR/AcrR family transcriptional regulator [Alphaproteobacteria bacterium]
MPWEKTFDTESTLTKAMEAFWVRGYEATSMQDLVDCMGIGRGSLYATFGDKRSLFIQALRLYDRLHRRDWTVRLAELPSGRSAIMAVFDGVIVASLEGGCRNGCLLMNTALELSPHDEEIEEIIKKCLEHMEAFFLEQLERGKAEGEIPNDLPTDQTAKGLLALLVSLRVFTRARPEPDLLRSISAEAEAMIS